MANSKNIDFDIITNNLSEQTNIEEADLCTILSNLLDNSIEACELQKNPHINVSIKMQNNHLHIIIKNTIQENVLETNPNLLSSKKHKLYHGLGLKIIKKLTNKYNGIMNIKIQGDYFSVIITLEENSSPVRLK